MISRCFEESLLPALNDVFLQLNQRLFLVSSTSFRTLILHFEKRKKETFSLSQLRVQQYHQDAKQTPLKQKQNETNTSTKQNNKNQPPAGNSLFLSVPSVYILTRSAPLSSSHFPPNTTVAAATHDCVATR